MYKSPTAAQLNAMQYGRDVAIVFPPRSKPDQMGTIHCPFPVTLTYENTPINACAALRDMELRIGTKVSDRENTPLFCTAASTVYSHGFLHSMLRMVLAYLYGPAVAALYTWHSYRAGLATALHAAKVPDEMIQLIFRWMCPESLHSYRRKGTREHERYINAASQQNVDAIQSSNVVKVQGDEGYAHFLSELNLGSTKRVFSKEAEKYERGPTTAAQSTAVQNPATTRQPSTTAAAAAPAKLSPAPADIKVGDAVVLPKRLWPKETCHELGGAGWTATVRKATATGTAATISFTHARSRDCRPYEDVLVPITHLCIAA